MAETARDSGAELLLLATEREVHAFDLSRVSRVRIGRHESNDLQLTSRTVSNFHAEITLSEGVLTLRDLGSTNGTHVNDSQVELEPLASGDRIRIGNHVMTMQLKPVNNPDEDAFIYYKKVPDVVGPGSEGRVISMRSRSVDPKTTLRGKGPNDMLLSDLLKLISASPRPLRVTLMKRDAQAFILVRRHRVVHAEYGDAIGEKALYRLFSWQDASYAIDEPPPEEAVTCTITLPTESLIVEGMEQALELGRRVATLPPLEARLRLKEDCPLPLTAHSPAEIEIFQLIIRHETIGQVLEHSSLTDVRVLRLVESLLRKGVFDVGSSSESEMEETLLPFRREH